MKKLTLFLLVLFGFALYQNSEAKWFSLLSEQTFAETAKTTMVSIVNETKSVYKKGMTESAFIDATLTDIPKNERSPQIENYFKRVFYYHNSGFTDSVIEQKEDGQTLKGLVDLASERGSINAAFFNDANNPGMPAFRPFKWWLKLLLVILDGLLGLL